MVQYEERQDYHERAEDYRESERDKVPRTNSTLAASGRAAILLKTLPSKLVPFSRLPGGDLGST
jgi:hypothetical protein